ncbi:MAG TPA: DUF1592 domain-containing protein [Humisphaera sp.]
MTPTERTIRLATTLLALALASVGAAVGSDKGTGADGGAPGVTAAAPTQPSAPPSVAGFLQAHCVRCHGPQKSKGGLAFHGLGDAVTSGADAERWARIVVVLQKGEMPPEDEAQPAPAERAAAVAAIRSRLATFEADAAARAALAPADAPTARRLTNFEYQNTMRDLLGIDLRYAERLPKDPDRRYHFNNTADLMLMGPEQIDLYLETARRAMDSAIVDPAKPPTLKTRAEWSDRPQPDRLPLRELSIWPGGRGNVSQGMAIKQFPRTGEFRLRVSASAVLVPGAREVPLRLMMGQPIAAFNLATLIVAPVGTVRLRNGPDAPQVFEFRGRIENYTPFKSRNKQGQPLPDTLTVTPQNLYDDGTLNDDNAFTKTRLRSTPRAAIDWMEFEGPLTETWPPEHHARILFDSPLRSADPDAYVRAVLRRFMSRAYRRPAADAEVERFVKVYATLLPELKTLEATMRETLSLVLVSPQFLYHTTVANDAGGGSRSLRQYELASRLSYFLWGSMPDDALLALAAAGKLDAPDAIAAQVRRLLADPRSGDFVRNFTTQWLNLEKMRTVPINRDLFPRFLYYVPVGERAGTEEPYRPTIRDHMMAETSAFVAELIRTNAGLMNVVHSDFACLNQPLAAHYGVPGVEGDQIRPVPVKPEHHLGGLLTHGSVLVGNGTGTVPHPIYRAVWLREAILGDDVPPPPADVPALSDSAGASAEKALSIKDLLAKHRQKESCRDCHARLDPWGIPFEQYNAIGRYQPAVPRDGTRVAPFKTATHRDLAGYEEYLRSINQVPVSAESRLPSGLKVRDLDELKAYLLRDRQQDIAANVVRRLLAYGLGRDLTWRDRPAVEALVKGSAPGGYRVGDLIVAVCQSETFRNPSPPVAR